jgi:hypothetical protein
MNRIMQTHITLTKKYPVSFFACLVAALLAWYTFHPGVFSIDSLSMYFNAKMGWHSDIHPVLLPYVLSVFFKLHIDLGFVILLQVLALFLGMRRFVLAIGQTLGLEGNHLLDWITTVIVFVFLLPITPFAIYAVTLWTDTWLLIFWLWALALLCEQLTNVNGDGEQRSSTKILGALFLILLSILVRYNALIVFPVLMLLVDRVVNQLTAHRIHRIGIFLSPLLVFGLFQVYQYRIANVQRTHPEYASYALDLASMIVSDPIVCTDLYIRSCSTVLHEFSREFVVGNGAIDFTINQGRDRVYKPFLTLVVDPRLPGEFFAAAKDHPVLLLKVKILNYLDYISPDPQRYFFQDHPAPNELGLTIEHSNPVLAAWWFDMTNNVIRHPVLRWFSFVHAPWLVLNLLGLVYCVKHLRKSETARLLLLILLVPALYYLSYMIFFTASEFRFMYPATLLVQIVLLTYFFSTILRRFHPRNGSRDLNFNR